MWIRLIMSALVPVITSGTLLRAAGLPSQKPAAGRKATTGQIKSLIAQLGDESRRVRVTAERSLLKIGPAVLPLLPPLELAPNLSAREAVKRIRVQLERQQAAESVRPSRVTLEGTYPLKAILERVSAQTGNRIDFSKLPGELLARRFACAYRRQTFWSTIDDLSQRVPLAFDFERDGLAARAAKAKPRRFADNQTAFRIAIVSVSTRPLVGNAKQRLLRVSWKIAAEPRLRPLFLKYGGNSVTASSGTARYAPFDPDASYELAMGEAGRGLLLHSDFLIPADKPPRSVRVAGALKLHVAAGTEPIVFRRLAGGAGTAIRRGGVTVTLQKAAFGKPRDNKRRKVRIRVAVGYDVGGPAFESHRTWIFHNRVYLERQGGKQFERAGGFKTTQQDDGAVGVEYNFEVPGGSPSDYRFVYVAPTLLIQVPVRFDVADIPVSAPQQEQRQP